MSTRNISRGKGGRCVELTTLAHSCADCLEIWEPQHPGTLRVCPGIKWDCFPLFSFCFLLKCASTCDMRYPTLLLIKIQGFCDKVPYRLVNITNVPKQTTVSNPDHSLPSLPNHYILKLGHSVLWDVGQPGRKEASNNTGAEAGKLQSWNGHFFLSEPTTRQLSALPQLYPPHSHASPIGSQLQSHLLIIQVNWFRRGHFSWNAQTLIMEEASSSGMTVAGHQDWKCPSRGYPVILACLLTYSMEESPLEKLKGFQLVKKNSPHFMEPEGSLPQSTVPASCPYPEPARSSLNPHIPLPEDPS